MGRFSPILWVTIALLALACAACGGKAQASTSSDFEIINVSAAEVPANANQAAVQSVYAAYPCLPARNTAYSATVVRNLGGGILVVRADSGEKRVQLINLTSGEATPTSDYNGIEIMVLRGNSPFMNEGNELIYGIANGQLINHQMIESGEAVFVETANNNECANIIRKDFAASSQ